MTSWYTQPVFNSHLAVAAIVIALAALLLVGPAFRKMSWQKRATLVGIRVAVILLVLIGLLQPARISTTTKPQTGVVLVMADVSRSMTLPSGTSSRTRYETQIDALNAAEPALAELAKQFDVKVYSYDSKLTAVEFKDGELLFPAKPEGKETDIGSSLAEAARRELGRRLLGVVLLGDGVQTALEPRVETQDAARELGRTGTPLFTTTFGPVGDAAQARDVAIEYMQDQYTVFVKNEVVIKGLARVTGFVNKEVPVELTIEDAKGNKEKLPPQVLLSKTDGPQLEVAFPYTPTKAGQYKLTLSAAHQPGELVTKNNQLESFLNVLEGGLRVLYLEGDLRLEQKFLRRSLNDSPDIDIDFQWIDHRAREKWPINFGDTFKNPKFDVLILGDLDSAAFSKETLTEMAAAIDKGKGFAMLGGFHRFGAGGYQSTVLADVLPVKMDRFLRQDFNAPINEGLHVKGPLRMKPVADHPLVRLAAASENAAAWDKLPPLRGANRFSEVKERFRPIASSGTTPLLIPGEYGNGRVLAFAGDSTWQWWMAGQQAEHRRFWRQVVLWLAKREENTQSDVWVRLAQRRHNPGAKVTFTMGAKSPSGDEVAGASFTAEVILPSGKKAPARLTKEGNTWTGVFSETAAPGDYKIEVTAKSDNQTIGTATAQFLVFDQDVELASQSADPELMSRLAQLTKDSGGRVVAPEQLSDLFRELLTKPREAPVETQTKWRLGDTALDAWAFFLAFVGLVGGEWFLRKKWGLV
jgi:uncharacterized membrane protein